MNRVQTGIEFVEKLDQDLAKATDIKEINAQARIYTINIIPFIPQLAVRGVSQVKFSMGG